MLRWTVVVRFQHAQRPFHAPRVHAAVTVGCEVYSFVGSGTGTHKKDPIEVHVFDTVSLLWRTLSLRECPVNVPTVYDGYTAVLIGDTTYI